MVIFAFCYATRARNVSRSILDVRRSLTITFDFDLFSIWYSSTFDFRRSCTWYTVQHIYKDTKKQESGVSQDITCFPFFERVCFWPSILFSPSKNRSNSILGLKRWSILVLAVRTSVVAHAHVRRPNYSEGIPVGWHWRLGSVLENRMETLPLAL